MLTPDQRQALLALALRVGELRGGLALCPHQLICSRSTPAFVGLILNFEPDEEDRRLIEWENQRVIAHRPSSLGYPDPTQHPWTPRQRQVFEGLVAERVGAIFGEEAFFQGVRWCPSIEWQNSCRIVSPGETFDLTRIDGVTYPLSVEYMAYPSDRATWTERQEAWFSQMMKEFHEGEG